MRDLGYRYCQNTFILCDGDCNGCVRRDYIADNTAALSELVINVCSSCTYYNKCRNCGCDTFNITHETLCSKYTPNIINLPSLDEIDITSTKFNQKV